MYLTKFVFVFTTKGTDLLDSGGHPIKTYQRPNHHAMSDKLTKMNSGKEPFLYYMKQKYDRHLVKSKFDPLTTHVVHCSYITANKEIGSKVIIALSRVMRFLKF